LVVVLMADLREMSLGLSLARYGSAPFALMLQAREKG
jgi:hypothetical protein